TIETARYLASVQQDVGSKLKIVFRCYTQKPRTNGGTWEGPAKQPDPTKPVDFNEGMRYARDLMRSVTQLGLAIADEAVFPHNAHAVEDLLSYVAIGARSSEDPLHRQHASGLDVAVGMKNPPDGNLDVAVNSMRAAQLPTDMYVRMQGEPWHVRSSGNPYAHVIMRGARSRPNTSLDDLAAVGLLMNLKGVSNPATIIDASHDNSIDPSSGKKDYNRQIDVVHEVLDYKSKHPAFHSHLRGFMIESFLRDGSQPLDSMVSNGIPLALDGLSCTDPCLGQEKTLDLIKAIYRRL
ncbi:MAG TPA: 3-deoxy-7-phosphoheptulonate synthase, partial [Acidobacteriota bacterium]|nr:3-deoxy-7-phosphoheptulonate synthase [Acidobacteriota bacterium]